MRRWIFSVVLALSILSISEQAFSQTSTFPWPMNPPVGIGITVPQNALQLNFNSSGHNDTAIIRLSNSAPTSIVYGIIGLMPFSYPYYSSISTGEDLIIHEHSQGDIILTNYQSTSLSHPFGAIRFATTPDSSNLPLVAPPPHDIERMSILPNGNIGIDLPPTIWHGLDSAMDQVQIGGGSVAPLGEPDPLPGLTFYGGNRFEGMLESRLGVGSFPVDLRYIGFNYAINHSDTAASRVFRMARTSSSAISFGDGDGASVDLGCFPYNADSGTNYFKRAIHFHFMGSKGLEVWKDLNDSDIYHHLFDCWVPGFPGYNWQIGGDNLRNVNGLFIHYTPVLITDSASAHVMNFTNFMNLRPDIGDDSTWMLAVDGPALFKQACVYDTVWSDFVFDQDYKLPSLAEVDAYTKTNHHLPGIPSEKEIKQTGIDLGVTDAKLLQKIEELTKYAIEQNKKIEQLEADVQELKNQKEK